jgi:hypothetical protein
MGMDEISEHKFSEITGQGQVVASLKCSNGIKGQVGSLKLYGGF